MASPDAPNFAEHLRTLSNDELVTTHIGLVFACDGNDEQTITYDFLESRPLSTTEESGTIEERLEQDELPPVVTTVEWEQYWLTRREVVRRAVGYLGLTEEDLFGRQ